MRTAGVLDMERMEVFLPSDQDLFDAPNSALFLQLVREGIPLASTRLRIQNSHIDVPPTSNLMSWQTLLYTTYLRIAAMRMSPFSKSSNTSTDTLTQDVIASILTHPILQPDLVDDRNLVPLIAWHEACINFTTDLDLLEVAAGRDGPAASIKAQVKVSRWFESPCSRRSTLHAAQVFRILSMSNASWTSIIGIDMILFSSALILYMHLLLGDIQNAGLAISPFDILSGVDWNQIQGLGLVEGDEPWTFAVTSLYKTSVGHCSALDFIRYGGTISLGKPTHGRGATARDILLQCIGLMNRFETPDKSRYSRILVTMSGMAIDAC